MFDWIGSLRLREHTERRVRLSLSPATRAAGLVAVLGGAWLVWMARAGALWLIVLPGVIVGLGLVLVTLRRDMTLDRGEGVLRVDQGVLGLTRSASVPLFHLRAVIIIARPGAGGAVRWLAPRRFVAFIERRVGEPIFLDESRRCASLLRIAEAIAEVAELRLEYDAMSRASGTL